MDAALAAQEQQLSTWFPTISQRRLRQALAAGGSLTAALDFLLRDEDDHEGDDGAGPAARAPVVPTIDLTDDAPPRHARKEDPPAAPVEVDPLHYLCELFPDAAIEYLRELLKKHPGEATVALVSEAVLEADGSYPKRSDQPAPGKNKRKAEDDGHSKRDNKRARGDYTTIQGEPMPAAYEERTYNQLTLAPPLEWLSPLPITQGTSRAYPPQGIGSIFRPGGRHRAESQERATTRMRLLL
ncbi:hypothetical protein HDU87_004266 [Geranomyces variabilis]|uniref:CUE domain-containing protein n=1 Tax=Geranomyces variabilis TaxID=109894 RepID=A0AAD5TP38_9FUNG|nr:hypothetical protein HDU87_004266 [Geranomyces variabilis]